MKKLIVIFLVFVLCISIVQAKGLSSSLTLNIDEGSIGNDQIVRAVEESYDGPVQITPTPTAVGTMRVPINGLLKSKMQTNQEIIDEALESLPSLEQQVLQNQNKVKMAAMLIRYAGESSEYKELIEISDNINESSEITIQAEEQIKNQNQIMKFISGGEKEAAGEILQETEMNQIRIQQLNQILSNSGFDSETKKILQEQIKNIESEQERLQTLAEGEISNNGIFGFLFSGFYSS